MKRVLAAVVSSLLLSACADTSPTGPSSLIAPAAPDANLVIGGTVFVSNSNNAGNGSFRVAIDQANSNPSIRNVEFLLRVGIISLQSGIVFTGTQDLKIDGNYATINGTGAGGTAFKATGGGDLSVSSLTVRNAPGEGIHVEVPPAATGVQRVSLFNVQILSNTGHGVLVNDQVDPTTSEDANGNPIQPNANGSAASLEVVVIGTRFVGNGYSVSDRDGLRVNEGGDGNLTLTLSLSRAEDNAADGVEIDERGSGDVTVNVFGTQFLRNGKQDPADLDDGFDIDEYNEGSIFGKVVLSSANDNFEEGFDFNENNAGDFKVDMTLVEASGNREEGIDYEEDDDFQGGGDLVTTMVGIKANGNGVDDGDGGLKIREKGLGDLDVTLTGITALENHQSEIFARETETGDARVRITKAVTNDNTNGFGPGHGIEVRESDAGSVTVATFVNIQTSTNAGFGLSVSNGTANITNVTGSGNGGGLTGGGATFVVVP